MAITVNSALKRQAVINDSLTALSRILAPLRAFSRAHNNVPLQGTNKIAVPYISLETSASTDWNAGNGYVAGDGTVGAKEITVNKRKYQSLGNDSATNTQQPYSMTDELIQQKLEKLCYDVLTDVMSNITAANYGLITGVTCAFASDIWTKTAHGISTGDRLDMISVTGGTGVATNDVVYGIKLTDDTFKVASTASNALAGTAIDVTSSNVTDATISVAGYTGAASGFGLTGVSKLQRVANDNNWPEGRRSLVLNSAFNQYAILDSGVVSALNYGSNEAVRKGTVPELLGFGYHGGRYVPANSQNLNGFICLPSAILFGCAPIAPTPAVRKMLTAYEQFTIPELDFVITYREFANAQMDTDQTIVECTYGYTTGEAAALKRIVTS